MTTIRQAQAAITAAGIPLEIVRGEGYHYFIYDDPVVDIYETVSVYVPYTNTYSAKGWVQQARYAYETVRDLIEEQFLSGV